MEQVHVMWVRKKIRWSEIESSRGDLNWDEVDAIFAALKKHPQLKPIIVLSSEPSWSRPVQPTPTAPPTNIDEFARFVGAFAARYGIQVDYYQVWDEPNLTAAWGNQEPNAT